MKATGIVRRVDDLGRIVIPKEIRRILRLREGDPMELYTDADVLVLKKYSPLTRFGDSGNLLKTILQLAQVPIILCDRDKAVDAAAVEKTKYEGLSLTDDISEIIGKRTFYVRGDDMPQITVFSGSDLTAEMITPIIAGNEIVGALVIPESRDLINMDRAASCLKFAAKYLELYWEEYQ